MFQIEEITKKWNVLFLFCHKTLQNPTIFFRNMSKNGDFPASISKHVEALASMFKQIHARAAMSKYDINRAGISKYDDARPNLFTQNSVPVSLRRSNVVL